MLDFIVLLRKADKLGIHFSTDGIKDLVQRDTGGRLTEEDYRKIETTMRHGPRTGSVSTEWLAQSIANEYRARVALLAVEGKPLFPELVRAQREQIFQFLGRLGVDLGSVRLPGKPSTETAIPGGMTPYEFYEFFKDRCSENTFQVLELDAKAYVDQVTEKPTKAELNALFAKHRGELPDPARERPGFKEPKKVKIEFVAVEATSPRITQAVPKMEAAGAFLQATTGVLTGDPMAALINAARPDAAAGSPLAPIDLVARVKARVRRSRPPRSRTPSWSGSISRHEIRASTVPSRSSRPWGCWRVSRTWPRSPVPSRPFTSTWSGWITRHACRC